MSLRRNTLWNLLGTGLPLTVGAVTIPYLIRQIGVEAFGVLTLVWALIGYFSLFDFGLGRALTQQVASSLASGDKARLPGLIKTGLIFIAFTGLAGGVVLASLSASLAENWLNVSPILIRETTGALLMASVGIPLTTATTGLRGVLEAFEDFRGVNFLRIALGVANFGLPALSVLLISNSLVLMVAGLVASRFLVLLAHIFLVSKKHSVSLCTSQFNKNEIKGLASFGAWMSVSNLISPLMVTADRFVISATLGASVVGYYTVPHEALVRLLLIPSALTTALFPRLSALRAQSMKDTRRLYRRCLLITAQVMLPLCTLIALGSHWGLSIWISEDFADQSWRIAAVLSIGIFMNGLAFIPFAAVQASGDARMTAQLHLIELLIYVPTLFALLDSFGLLGAALAWTGRVTFDLFALLLAARSKGF